MAASNIEKVLYIAGGAAAGAIVMSILMNNSHSYRPSGNSSDKTKPLALKKELQRCLDAYASLEYYDVCTSLRDILHKDLKKDGTANNRPVPKSLQILIEKRLNLTPATTEPETDTVNETAEQIEDNN